MYTYADDKGRGSDGASESPPHGFMAAERSRHFYFVAFSKNSKARILLINFPFSVTGFTTIFFIIYFECAFT